jgi:signal transduction histidine kinase
MQQEPTANLGRRPVGGGATGTAPDPAARQRVTLDGPTVSHVSHELRTPLSALYQSVTILLDGLAGTITAEQREYLGMALRNVHQLRSMIDDLVELTRIESGALGIQRRGVVVSELLDEAVRRFAAIARTRSVTVSSDGSEDLPSAHGDPDRMRQMLAKLVDNAIKFTPDGGEVSLTAAIDPEDAGFVRITVADSGCGIPPDAAPRIFDLFWTGGRRGLGLGLHLCRRLAGEQGGRIWVESRAGEGSRFHFTVPALSADDVLRSVRRTTEASSAALARAGRE